MKQSIRARYTLIIVCVLVAILLAVILFMNFGLEPFVAKKKQTAIREAVTKIENCVNDGWLEDDSYELMRVATQNNFGIAVFDASGYRPMRLFSTNFNLEMGEQRFLDYIHNERVAVDDILEQGNNYAIYKIYDEIMGADQIECMGHNDSNVAYIITTSMAGIKESASMAIQFLIYAMIVGVVVAAILIYFICKSITKPIINLAKQSQQISNLDFSGKYDGKSQDEIGVLGNNMNKMSIHLKNTIDKLQDANEKLAEDVAEKEKINQAQKEFLGNVSHELKTPIALIMGYAEGLKDGVANDIDSANYYTDVIVDESKKMNLIVKRLLSLDEIESGRLMPVMEDFDLVEVVKGIIASSSYLSKDKHAQINLVSPEKLIINADEFMIEQAFQNYLSNACHYVDDNGTITVKLSRCEDKTLVSVHNTGSNIADEDIEYIWDKFYKTDKARTRSYGGSGIGLSIVKSIVELHKGSVAVRNTEDGVEFSFLL